MGFTGLPKSGKTTLLDEMLPPSTNKCCVAKGLAIYEMGIAVAPGDEVSDHDWDEFTRQHAHIFMLARALVSECKEGFSPSLKKSDAGKIQGLLMSKGLENKHLQKEFSNVFNIMMDILPKINRFTLCQCKLQPDIVLINVWDIGVENALYEVLPLLARVANPLVLVNLLDLPRDAEKLHFCPKISDADVKERIMKFRSRCHYFVRIAGLSKRKEVDTPTSILVATHRDQMPADKVCSQVRRAETIIRAKASDMGVASALYPTMITIDARKKADCRHVQHALEKVMYSSKKFEKSLRLKWIFLRTALVNYETERSKFCISRADFDDLAKQCGLTATERDDFLKFFSELGSLISLSEILHENIVCKPDIFLQELNKLYVYTTGNEEPDQHTAESLKKGILCWDVANQLWGHDVDFFWNVLQESGLAAATKSESRKLQYDYGIKCPYRICHNTNCLFIPSVRNKAKTEPEHGDKSTKNDSLFITFNSEYVPTDIQAVIVRYMKLFCSEAQLKLTEEYNSTKFTFNGEEKDLVVIVHGDVIEIQPANSCQKHALKQLCLHVLERVMEYFPGMEYELGFICRNSKEKDPARRRKVHYVHFLPTQNEERLYCFHCHENVELSKKKQEWMQEKNEMHVSVLLSICAASTCYATFRLNHVPPQIKNPT